MALHAPPPSCRRWSVGDCAAVHGQRPHRARLEPRPDHRHARQGRRHPLCGQLRHLSVAPRQHRRCAACRRPARGADDAVSMRLAQRGTRPRPRRRRPAATSAASRAQEQGGRAHAARAAALRLCLQLKQAIFFAPSVRARAAATLALRTAHTPGTTRVAAHAPLLQQPQPQDSSTNTRRTASRTHRARSPSTAASSSAADSRHDARTTSHDDEKMLHAHTGTKPETPIDGVL